MKRTALFAFAIVIVVVMGLPCPSGSLAGSTPPALQARNVGHPHGDAIPAVILTAPAIDTLDRLIFRHENVHFNFDSSVLLPAGQRALRRKALWLQTHPDATVIVEGHCDQRGSAAYNRALGHLRAEAARDFLIELGIAPERIRLVSWGEARPETEAQGEAAWHRNRRAEVIPR